MTRLHPSEIHYTKRWFCYLDLLGFTELVKSTDINHVLEIYEEALEQIKRSEDEKSVHGISFSWFSDTFIIYSKFGTAKEFSLVEQAGRLFFQGLILKQIPVRGAITFGELYTQQERNVFIGPALIDAYRYGEGQNWLGFLLTPAAVEQMDRVGLSIQNRPFYRKVTGSKILKCGLDGPAYAYAFNNGGGQGRNPFISALTSMKNQVDLEYSIKYIRTIEFIQEHFKKSITPPSSNA